MLLLKWVCLPLIRQLECTVLHREHQLQKKNTKTSRLTKSWKCSPICSFQFQWPRPLSKLPECESMIKLCFPSLNVGSMSVCPSCYTFALRIWVLHHWMFNSYSNFSKDSYIVHVLTVTRRVTKKVVKEGKWRNICPVRSCFLTAFQSKKVSLLTKTSGECYVLENAGMTGGKDLAPQQTEDRVEDSHWGLQPNPRIHQPPPEMRPDLNLQAANRPVWIMSPPDSPHWDCKTAEQTVHHVLQDCPLWDVQRRQTWPQEVPTTIKLWRMAQDLSSTAKFLAALDIRVWYGWSNEAGMTGEVTQTNKAIWFTLDLPGIPLLLCLFPGRQWRSRQAILFTLAHHGFCLQLCHFWRHWWWYQHVASKMSVVDTTQYHMK